MGVTALKPGGGAPLPPGPDQDALIKAATAELTERDDMLQRRAGKRADDGFSKGGKINHVSCSERRRLEQTRKAAFAAMESRTMSRHSACIFSIDVKRFSMASNIL